MMDNLFKKMPWLRPVLIGLEVAVVLALVAISIITMVTMGKSTIPFIKWLQLNPFWMFLLIVFPLVLLFLFNIYLLIKTLSVSQNPSIHKLSNEELLEEARRQAREELKKEMEKNDSKEKQTP